MNANNKFIVCAAGIFVSYFYFGILQEKITRGKYFYEVTNEDGTVNTVTERYKYFLVLVFVQCFVSYCFAKSLLYVWPHGEDKTPTVYYSSGALTYLLAMVCSNMALQWVPYPTQVRFQQAGRKRIGERSYSCGPDQSSLTKFTR